MVPPGLTLIVSVDTEEDNWEPSRTCLTVQNIRELGRLDRLFERLGVRATYFTTYQVAVTPWAAEVLRGLASSGRAEIGAHLHPWNTPPLEERFEPRHTMLTNLPPALQEAKVLRLTDALEAAVGERPSTFRAGRYGLGRGTAAVLLACGYRTDSSVTPFVSWEWPDQGPSYIGAPVEPYWIAARGDPCVPSPSGELVEVPLSVGYSRLPWTFWSRVHDALDAPALKPLRLVGVASRMGVVKRVILNPELDTVPNMLVLARRLVDQGVRYAHLAWHSSSLLPGMTPYTSSWADVEAFYGAVESFVERLSAIASVRCATVGEVANAFVAAPSSLPVTKEEPRVRLDVRAHAP